ncbi:hypothetical protein CRYUN_Cryun08bG0082700 [Craigia yunnanensis]
MWALRRVANPLKDRRISIGSSYATSARLLISSNYIKEKAVIFESSQTISTKRLSCLRFYHSTHASSNFPVGRCGLSSQAGAESSGEENGLEDGFSELETPVDAETKENHVAWDETENGLVSDPELSGDEEDVEETASNELELSEAETAPSDKRSSTGRTTSELFKAVISAPGLSVHKVLDKWLEEGKDLSRDEISEAFLNLRKRRMYGMALRVI